MDCRNGYLPMKKEEVRRFTRLYEHAAALEIELARYASKYGLTAEAERLLANSPLKEPPPSS
jgi:hypothetical protein